jgi:hypothetical protein
VNGDDEAWSADAAMARIDAGVKRSWLATWEEGSDDDDSEGEDEDLIESDGEDADEAEEEADGCRSRSKRRRLVARMLSAVTDAVSRENFIATVRHTDTNLTLRLTVLSIAPIQN